LRWALLGAACWIVLAAVLARLAVAASFQLRAPFDLNYESQVVASIEVLRAGRNLYGAEVFDAPPFVLTIYTPLYLWIVAGLPALGHPFLAGRLVALACMLGSAALLFAAPPTRHAGGRRLRLAAAALGAAAFLGLWPVTINAALVKNDPLALLCAAGAVVLVARGRSLGVHTVLPALLCVLSVAAKQSYLAAPAACALHLLIADRRRGVAFLLALAAAGGLFALGASLQWGHGFWFCTLAAARHPESFEQAARVMTVLAHQPLAVVLPLVALLLLAARLPRLRALLAESPGPGWLLLSALTFAATVGKQGASVNYVLEPALASASWLAAALPGALQPAESRPRWRARAAAGAATVLALATGLDVALAPRTTWSLTDDARTAWRLRAEAELRARIVRLAGDDGAILGTFAQLLPASLASRSWISDPLVYAILWEQGTLSPAPVVTCLRRAQPAVVILDSGVNVRRPPPGPAGEFLAAVARSYRRAERAHHMDFYVPRWR